MPSSSPRPTPPSERVAYFFDEIRMQLPFPFNEKHHLHFKIHNTNTYDGVEALPCFGFNRLYDDDVVDDLTTPSPSCA